MTEDQRESRDGDEAYDYAVNFATSLHGKYYAEAAPNWRPLETTIGVLTQIDNMVAGIIEADRKVSRSEIAAPTEDEIAAYRDLFRSQLSKNMEARFCASPSTDAHRVALRQFVEKRNGR